MKNELGGLIMKEFVGLKANRYSYLKETNDEVKTKFFKFPELLPYMVDEMLQK